MALDLDAAIRAKIAAGALAHTPQAADYITGGSAERCDACDERILSTDLEYGVRFASGRVVRLHRRCYWAWFDASPASNAYDRGERLPTNVTFEIPCRAVFEMQLKGGPLPPGVTTPNNLGATMVINCSEDHALAMEAWLRIAAGKDYGDRDASILLKSAERIARARGA
jgi:hypothetical protein